MDDNTAALVALGLILDQSISFFVGGLTAFAFTLASTWKL